MRWAGLNVRADNACGHQPGNGKAQNETCSDTACQYRNVDALIEAGLAKGEPDPTSRRSVLIYLTPNGKKKASELPKIIGAVNTRFLSPLSAEEKKDVIALLHKVADIPEGGDPNL